jgi:hypothetical protein
MSDGQSEPTGSARISEALRRKPAPQGEPAFVPGADAAQDAEGKERHGEDLIKDGLVHRQQEQKERIAELLDEAGAAAWQARHKVRPKINYLKFESRFKAEAELRKLRATIDQAFDEISKIKNELVADEDFKRMVREHQAEINAVYRGESQ